MGSREHETSVQPWGTLEELLLACAVNRHGTKRWDSVAMELQTRSSAAGLTPDSCRKRFHDLRRRFAGQNQDGGDESDSAGLVPMVHELTKIRVDDLRRDLRRRDVSIVSLELKVKRLEEERKTSLKTEKDSRVESLRKNRQEGEESPENRRGGGSKSEVDGGSDSNRSFNESNSTTQPKRDSERNRRKRRNGVVAAADAEKSEPKPKPEADTNGESDRARDKEVEDEEDNEAVVRESNSAKQSSEVQSSSKRRRLGGGGGGGGEEPEEEEESPATTTTKRLSAIKSEPFVRLLGIVRSHRLGSVFQRRLRSQESLRYKNMVRQHMDLQTIEARLEKGVYSDHSHKFFRDLLLLFSNAVVFFRRGSQENLAARELRSLVLKEMKTNNKKLGSKSKTLTAIKPEQPKREADNVIVPPKPNKNKSSNIVTCGKRTGTSTNNNPSTTKVISEGTNKKGIDGTKKERVVVMEEKANKGNGNKKNTGSSDFVSVEDKGIRKKRSKERVGVGHGRRGLRNGSSGSTTNNSGESSEREFGGNELSSHDVAVKATEMVKKESVKKKQGAASFLKRMKQNSPKEVKDDEDVSNKDDHEESEVEKEEEVEEDNEEEEDRSKVEKKEEDEKKRKARKLNKSPASGGAASKDQKRVTRNSAAKGRVAKEESSRKAKRGVGRPPKRPEKAAANGKKAGRDTNVDHQREAGVGSGGRPRKRSRR